MNKIKSLTPQIASVMVDQGTERPGSSTYVVPPSEGGSYVCRRCGLGLFRVADQFKSHCGWPSFDATVSDHVAQLPDADGSRTEIRCHQCDSHLGHVFTGEQLTAKNTRHCVNGIALDWVKDDEIEQSDEIIVAGGCFWGVADLLAKLDGVLITEVGYCGGQLDGPSYEQVCRGNSGHIESVRVVFNPKTINLETVLKCFFEIHNPEQNDGQGPDIGSQYLSAIFYYDNEQLTIAKKLINQLIENDYKPSTQLLAMQTFWCAEDYHQQYYQKNQQAPYCHQRTKRFN